MAFGFEAFAKSGADHENICECIFNIQVAVFPAVKRRQVYVVSL